MIERSPLVGLAVGDALGMPFETASMFSGALLDWDGSFQPSAYHKLQPGQWTDDTMMSKLLIESLLARQGFDPVDVSTRYRDWYRSGDHRGMGRSTKEALRRLDSGVDWTLAGEKGAEGNGTAMRAGVLGAFYAGDPVSAADFARVDATLTHGSAEAEEGSAAVAMAVSLLCSGITPVAMLAEVHHRLRPSKVRSGLQTVAGMVRDRVQAKDVLGTTLQTGAHVVQTVPAAFAAFLLTDSYFAAIDCAIRAGGDTDSTAAVAGGIAGTFYGHEAIPATYTAGLEAHDQLRAIERVVFSR